ncbi:10064_t:CDS:2, partial [Funneliformis geosporum]
MEFLIDSVNKNDRNKDLQDEYKFNMDYNDNKTTSKDYGENPLHDEKSEKSDELNNNLIKQDIE